MERRLRELAEAHPEGHTPLPRLGVELLHLSGMSDQVVSGLRINKHWIAVERGAAELDPATFRLADHYIDHWGWLAR